jgi:hypothetical protein
MSLGPRHIRRIEPGQATGAAQSLDQSAQEQFRRDDQHQGHADDERGHHVAAANSTDMSPSEGRI